MRKTFVSNLILLVGLNLLIKPFYILGIEAEIQNRVGASDFGSYFALINFSILLNIIPDMGINNWNTRKVAQEGLVNSKYLGSLMSLRLSLALIYALICLVIGLFLGYNSTQLFGLSLLIVNQVVASLILFFRSNLSGLHLFKHDSVLSILDKLLLIIILGYALWFAPELEFKIEYLIYAQTLTLVITLLLSIYWVSKHVKKWNWEIDKSLQKEILRGSLPFATLILFSMIIFRADSVILERLDGAESSGIYAMGFRIFESYIMISYLFAGLLLPIFSKMLSNNAPVGTLVSLSGRILFSVTWSFCLLGFLVPGEFLGIIYDNPTEESIQTFRWLMPGCFAFSMQYIYGTLLTADGKLKTLNAIMISMSLLNILLNLIWIPLEGPIASAKVNAISHMTILVTQVILVGKYYNINLFHLYRETIVYAIATSLLGVFLFTIKTLPALNEISILYKVALYSILCLLLALIAKMISYKGVLELLRSNK